jgi:hypothetical protein
MTLFDPTIPELLVRPEYEDVSSIIANRISLVNYTETIAEAALVKMEQMLIEGSARERRIKRIQNVTDGTNLIGEAAGMRVSEYNPAYDQAKLREQQNRDYIDGVSADYFGDPDEYDPRTLESKRIIAARKAAERALDNGEQFSSEAFVEFSKSDVIAA